MSGRMTRYYKTLTDKILADTRFNVAGPFADKTLMWGLRLPSRAPGGQFLHLFSLRLDPGDALGLP